MIDVPKGYKQTEVGVIPEDWEVAKLARVCSMKSGEGVTSASIDQFSKYPCYGGNGLRGFTTRFTHNGGYALIGRQGALCGNVVGVDGKFFASEHAIVVTASARTDIRWLTFVLGKMRLNQYSESSAQPGLSVSKLLHLNLAVPPTKAEQESIAEVLSDADALIESLEQLIAKKRRLKQGAMQELLTGKKRLPGFETVGAIHELPLQNVPHGWEVKTFGDVFNIVAGGDVDPKRTISYQDQTHCYPIYSNALTEFGLYGYCSYADHQAGSITVTARGTLGFANFRDHAYTAIGRVLVLQPKQKSDGRFLAEVINNSIKFAIESTGVPQLTAPQISAYKLTIPPFPEQTAIATILSDMDAEIAALESKLAKTRQLKQGMMHNLLTGRIRLI